MRVENITLKFDKKIQLSNAKSDISTNSAEQNYDNVDYSQIPFCAIYNVKPKKLLNIGFEQSKLLKHLGEILEAEPKDFNVEDVISKAFSDAMAVLKAKTARHQAIMEEVDRIQESRLLSPKQKVDQLNVKLKELKQIEKMKLKPEKTPTKKADERIDYRLINIFKNSISEGEFGLAKIFSEYYSELNNVKTVKELNEKFPNIKTPQIPKEVIIKKITDTLTRDFYEKIDDEVQKDSHKAADNLYLNVKNIVVEIAKKLNINPQEFCTKVLDDTSVTVAEIYRKAKQEGFSMLPINRKIKTPQISELDLKLFSVDFDDFVLSTVREHYLNGKKLNQIVYSDGNTTIPLSSLNNSEYKFEKMSEKVKAIIRTAEEIKLSQRNYDLFDFNILKERLDYYSNTKFFDNEKLFERFIDFDACGVEDKDDLIKFLRVLDDISDGQKTLEEGAEFVYKENIYPKQVHNLSEVERQKNIEKLKIEQQKTYELKSLKHDFDECMNILYTQNLTHVATICSKYRPKSLNPKDIEDAKFIMDLVKKMSKDDVSKFEKSIIRWDTYKRYSVNEANTEQFQNALKYATDESSRLNTDKAGQYLINSEIIDLYPESKELYKYPDILEKIMEKSGDDKEIAMKLLLKFDDFDDMLPEEKTSILKILKKFDLKDSIDKYILKLIVENKYIHTDYSTTIMKSGSSAEEQIATISSKAKQQIISKYKYPVCLEYFEAFEQALSQTASSKGSAGIKNISRNNNKAKYDRELKIMGHDDRLYPSQNDYVFDVFSDKGIH